MEKNKIFLSHRHSDTQSDCHRIRETLEEEFGEETVFLDIENLAPGIRFADAIDQALKESKVVLVAIGPNWHGEPDENGVTRIFQENDWVRREVSAALSRSDTRVIPLLLKGATRPTADKLPEDLKDLANLQTFEISITRWKYDLGVLVDALAKLIPRKKSKANPSLHKSTPLPRPQKSWWATNYLWVIAVLVIITILASLTDETSEPDPIMPSDDNSSVGPVSPSSPVEPPSTVSSISVNGEWVLYLENEVASTLIVTQNSEEVQFLEYNALNNTIGSGNGYLEETHLYMDYYNTVINMNGQLYFSTEDDGESWQGTVTFPATGLSSKLALRRN